MFRLGVLATMRPGELYGLRWSDVDLASGLVDIEFALEESSKRKLVRAKADSARNVPIDPKTIAALERLAYARRGAGKGPFVFVSRR